MAIVFLTIIVAFLVVSVVAMWKLYEKMGRHGWESLIPIWNAYVLYSIIWGKKWPYTLFGPVCLEIIILLLLRFCTNQALMLAFTDAAGYASVLSVLQILTVLTPIVALINFVVVALTMYMFFIRFGKSALFAGFGAIGPVIPTILGLIGININIINLVCACCPFVFCLICAFDSSDFT